MAHLKNSNCVRVHMARKSTILILKRTLQLSWEQSLVLYLVPVTLLLARLFSEKGSLDIAHSDIKFTLCTLGWPWISRNLASVSLVLGLQVVTCPGHFSPCRTRSLPMKHQLFGFCLRASGNRYPVSFFCELSFSYEKLLYVSHIRGNTYAIWLLMLAHFT